jgi:type IV secretory pathway protease TraF
VTTILLVAIGIGVAGLALLVARRLTRDDVGRSMRRWQQALAVLGEMAARADRGRA